MEGKKVRQTKCDCVKVACVVHEFTHTHVYIDLRAIAEERKWQTKTIIKRFDIVNVYCEHTLNIY